MLANDAFIIKFIHARQILDSRGNPTVEADVILNGGGAGRAAVPSGASTGSGEALELRDQDPTRYHGKSVLKAVWNVNNKIADILVANDARNQQAIDQLMLDLDGTANKANLGANAILAVSLATAKAVASALRLPFYAYLADLAGTRENMCLPMPMMNIINGGSHAAWHSDFQEYMIMPLSAESMPHALRMGAEIFHALQEILRSRHLDTNVGDEGGFAPYLNHDNNLPLDLIANAVKAAGYTLGKDVAFAMDIAASELAVGDHYELKSNGDWKSADDLSNWYDWILNHYPLVSLEDGLGEKDWSNWEKLTARFGDRLQLVGDDLFVTNVKLLQKGINAKVANAILIKPNQIGTLSETIATVQLAQKNHYRCIISHRSGETLDTSIAHLAVGLGAGQIKAGSLSRGERLAKYNELLRIAEQNSTLPLNNPF